MKHFYLTLFLVVIFGRGYSQTSFEEKPTSVSNVGLTVTNVGTIGNAFRGSFDAGSPSCEYPKNSGIEHLFEGGIWIGSLINGSLTAVSTAAYDNPTGYATGKKGFEMTAEIGSSLKERSSLYSSPDFSPSAISHQDFIADFSDKNIMVPGTSIPIDGHDNPMKVGVHLESYNWNYSFSDFFVILNFRITNNGTDELKDLYFGMWTNNVIRNVNITPAGQGGSNFYNKGGDGFIDTLSMAYGFDAAGDTGFTDSYFGHKFLGAEDKNGFHHPKLDTGFKCNYQAWSFNNSADPIFFLPTDEISRYNKMTTGLNYHKCWEKNNTEDPQCPSKSYSYSLGLAGNRSDLVSVGPFISLKPGESIDVGWSIILAKMKDDGQPNSANTVKQKENFVMNAGWAQTAYNGEDSNFNGILEADEDKNGDGKITRFILPSPPDIPKTKIIARDHAIDIYWSDNSESSIDPITKIKDFEGYNVYMSKVGFDVEGDNDLLKSLNKIASYDKKGNNLFYETGFESPRLSAPVTFEGDTIKYNYKYTIENILNGWQYAVGVSAFDEGNKETNLESLESSLLGNHFRAFPGKPSNKDLKTAKPFAYPNPYYLGASWEGMSIYQEDKKLIFANLPENCKVRIFTSAGDLIDEFEHSASYKGEDTRWYDSYSDSETVVQPGGEHSWDLLSRDSQIISRGLYLFTIEDLKTGKQEKSKFVIIK